MQFRGQVGSKIQFWNQPNNSGAFISIERRKKQVVLDSGLWL